MLSLFFFVVIFIFESGHLAKFVWVLYDFACQFLNKSGHLAKKSGHLAIYGQKSGQQKWVKISSKGLKTGVFRLFLG